MKTLATLVAALLFLFSSMLGSTCLWAASADDSGLPAPPTPTATPSPAVAPTATLPISPSTLGATQKPINDYVWYSGVGLAPGGGSAHVSRQARQVKGADNSKKFSGNH